MNWTGGRLQRHSNSNTLTHRQKQHFAKVRTQHPNADETSSPRFRPRYFPPDETEEEVLAAAFGRSSPIKRQQALDQHETLVSLVQRLPSMKPRPTRQPSTRPSPTHRHISPWTIQDPWRTVGRSLLPLHEGDLFFPPTAVVPSAKTQDGRKPPCRTEHVGQKGQAKKKRALDGAIKDDVVERERDRLLARHDWAGLSPSRPLRMQFPSVRERETIGKRHKTCSNRVHKANGGGATRAPVLTKIHADLGGPWMSGALVNHDEDIVVRIGPDALESQPPAQNNDSHEPEHRLTPSDPMLFDMEDEVQELQPICARQPSTEREKDQTRHLINLPDTDKGSEEARTYTEAEPVEDIERLLQELDEFPRQAPVTPASKADALLASAYDCNADSGNDQQERIRTSDTHKEELTQCPTSLQEVESGGEGNNLDRAETRVQTEGQQELQSSLPKPSWLLSKYSSTKPSAQGLHYNLARASNEPESRSSLELIDCRSLLEEGFDDIRRLEVQGCALDRTDQSSVARRTCSEWQTPSRGVGEGHDSLTALRDSSADRAARPRLSAELPINIYAGHRANARSRWVKRNQPIGRSPNSAFPSEREAANTFRRSCSDALHSQASDSVPDIRSSESPSGSRCQITVQAEKVPAAPTQGWIGDAGSGAEVEDAEAVWKRFVFGESDRPTIDSAQQERESPEPGVRSTLTPGWSTISSLWVETSGNSAAAGPTAMSPAYAHLHSVGSRAGADDTADASAGRAMTSGEKQASESKAFVEGGSTTAIASPTDDRCLPVRIHDADAQANQASDDANTVAATAGESSGELAGLGRRERIIFTKPKAFVGSMAVARPVAGAAAPEGNNASKGTLHTGPAGIANKISRERRRGQRTTKFSSLIYGIPSRTGYVPDLIEHIEDD